MKASLGKTILLVAGVLGILQGLMALIGGLVAAHDTSKDDIPAANIIPLGKYYCGGIRYIRSNPLSCDFDSLDRGWFRRVYNMKKDDAYPAHGMMTTFDKDGFDKLVGYEAVMSYAIICGVGWIVAGVLTIIASSKQSKSLALISAIIFTVLYCLFVALFGAVWNSVRKIDDDCQAAYDECSSFNKHARQSSREFLAYSICSFVLIMAAIVGTFVAVFATEAEPVAHADKPSEVISSSTPAKTQDVTLIPMAQATKQTPAAGAEIKAVAKSEVKKEQGAPVTAAAKDYIEKFDKVNKYLADGKKMDTYSHKKFDQNDTDKSGKLILKEFKGFISSIMAKKNLPPPSDSKIEALMKKYDQDKNGALDRTEFEHLLFDVFMGSREALIRKFATTKAESWKAVKGVAGDAGEAEKLGQLLKDTNKFYEELESVAKEVDKDKSSTLSIDEVTDLINRFCTRYKMPAVKKDDIIEVMNDMGRPIKEYSPHDLRMVALAILSIVKCLVTSK